jgi:hypothetical protein
MNRQQEQSRGIGSAFKSLGVIQNGGFLPTPEWFVYGRDAADEPSTGTMGAITRRIGHKFRDRFTEWLAAIQLLTIGLILLHPQDSFGDSKVFVAMAAWMPEYCWAYLLTGTGALGIVGLIVNGSMESVTPWIRVGRAMMGIITFSMLSVGLIIAYEVYDYVLAVMLGFSLPMVAAEFGAIYYGIMDARIYQNGRRDRRINGK